MTAVAGPFVFSSDLFSDTHVAKAKAAGCSALPLQLGAAPAAAAEKVRAAGLQVIGWGAANAETKSELDAMRPSVWMPQAESTSEFEALAAALASGAGKGLPIEPVMTAGGMEPPGEPTPEQKLAERARRRDLLRSFQVTKVWVEVYAQDADRSGQTQLGDVEHMCGFFRQSYGFAEAHPVIGLWGVDGTQPWARNPYSLSRYDLSQHGRLFGCWRAEQMPGERYLEIAAWVAVTSLFPAPVDSATNREAAQRLLAHSVQHWRASGLSEVKIAVQRQTLAWRCLNVTQSGTNLRALKAALDAAGAPRP